MGEGKHVHDIGRIGTIVAYGRENVHEASWDAQNIKRIVYRRCPYHKGTFPIYSWVEKCICACVMAILWPYILGSVQ